MFETIHELLIGRDVDGRDDTDADCISDGSDSYG
jgi:hypothetical protein